jgi:hypothetical protein
VCNSTEVYLLPMGALLPNENLHFDFFWFISLLYFFPFIANYKLTISCTFIILLYYYYYSNIKLLGQVAPQIYYYFVFFQKIIHTLAYIASLNIISIETSDFHFKAVALLLFHFNAVALPIYCSNDTPYITLVSH